MSQKIILPQKAEIDAMEDVVALNELAEKIEFNITKIRTDLEYSGRDDDWYERAKTALTYHQVTMSRVKQRIHRLTRKTNGNVDQAIRAKEAKAQKKQAHAQQIAELNEGRRIELEAKKLRSRQEMSSLISRLNADSIFRKFAARMLSAEDFAAIQKAADEHYLRLVENMIAERG